MSDRLDSELYDGRPVRLPRRVVHDVKPPFVSCPRCGKRLTTEDLVDAHRGGVPCDTLKEIP